MTATLESPAALAESKAAFTQAFLNEPRLNDYGFVFMTGPKEEYRGIQVTLPDTALHLSQSARDLIEGLLAQSGLPETIRVDNSVAVNKSDELTRLDRLEKQAQQAGSSRGAARY